MVSVPAFRLTGADAPMEVAERLLKRAAAALRDAAPADGLRLGFAHIH